MQNAAERIANDLAGVLSGGRSDVFADKFSRLAFSTDASIYQIMPACVVRPRNTADIAAVVKYAARYNIPIAARGGGSGLAGESLTSGIVIDTTYHMNKIISADDDGHTVTCQPGAVLDDINNFLARFGRKIGPDPSSGDRAVIGGVVANNATGAHSLQFGYIADFVESLELVLADGAIVEFVNDYDLAGYDDYRAGVAVEYARKLQQLLEGADSVIESSLPRTKRNRCGYNIAGVCHDGTVDMARLMVGSEGTLGIFTSITLRTVATPGAKALLQLEFASMEDMAKAVPIVVDGGASACELMDRNLIDVAIKALPQYSDIFPQGCAALLMVEHTGDDTQQVIDKIEQTESAVGSLASGRMRVFDPADQQRLWKSRKDAVPLLNRQKGAAHPVPFIEDVSVENHLLDKYIAGLEQIGDRYATPLTFYGHAGDGELHVRPYLDLSSSQDVQKMRNIANEVFELAWSLGGTVSGEHADGLLRASFIKRQYGSEYYELLRRVKDIFDPAGIMNPGKIINDDPDIMIKNLRAAHLPIAERLETNLLFAPDEFRFEVEQCNGCGLCRSSQPGGRMCPLFRATGGELYSSRGKANMIRAWIDGLLSEKDIASEKFRLILDLCVNCKMCSVECPSAVDVSKIVIEARAQAAKKRGLTITEKILAHNRYLSMAGSFFAPLSNMVISLSPFRWFLEKAAGLDRTRPMPAFARGTFIKKARRYLADTPLAKPKPIAEPVDRVAYFVDSYANYNDHSIGFAVIKVLRHNNIDVIIPDQRPAPLPAMVYGDIDTARSELSFSVGHLASAVRDGYKIVCSEPSAALCLRDELRLLIDSKDARLVSANTYELMDYLESLRLAGKLRAATMKDSAATTKDSTVFAYHAPCHLCALGLRGRSIQLLTELAGARITDVDSSCCGLAGTCGMQKKNHRLSADIGRDMANAINAVDAPRVLTECSACGMQIEHLTGKEVLHPIKILATAYGLP